MTVPAQPQPETCQVPQSKEAVDCWLEKWGRHKVVAGEEPMTREDIERLIEVNGGTAEGLSLALRDLRDAQLGFIDLKGGNLEGANLEGADLSMAILQGANLDGADLQGTNLGRADLQGADLRGANLKYTRGFDVKLQGANLRFAHLERAKFMWAKLQGADLLWATLQGADLQYSNLDGANLENAKMEGIKLHGARLARDTTNLRRADWGKKMKLGEELQENWRECLDPYRDLKQWYQHNGDHEAAGKFHYREWECRRKLAQHNWKLRGDAQGWRARVAHKYRSAKEFAKLWLYRLLYGYGEHPWRVARAGAAVIAFFALFLYLPYLIPQGTSLCMDSAQCWETFATYLWRSLYFSGVSFTALGYGDFAKGYAPDGWAPYLGVVESFVGISLIALFLVTFTRKMTR